MGGFSPHFFFFIFFLFSSNIDGYFQMWCEIFCFSEKFFEWAKRKEHAKRNWSKLENAIGENSHFHSSQATSKKKKKKREKQIWFNPHFMSFFLTFGMTNDPWHSWRLSLCICFIKKLPLKVTCLWKIVLTQTHLQIKTIWWIQKVKRFMRFNTKRKIIFYFWFQKPHFHVGESTKSV